MNSAHLGRFEGALFEGFAEDGVDGFDTLGETVLTGPREADPFSCSHFCFGDRMGSKRPKEHPCKNAN